jgi:hypothetical protein
LVLAAVFPATACLAESWRPARLDDGRVDLQGVWNLSNLTPLERLSGFDSLVISREQAQEIEERITGMRKNQATGGAPEQFDEVRTVEPIDGEWRSSVIVEPADGRIPGNAAFQQQTTSYRTRSTLSADGPEERPPAERCLSSPASTPPMVSVPTLNLHQIVQTPGVVLIQSEWNREARIVRMNAQHNPAVLASWLGDSVGWWEGDTLVVETRYFAAASQLRWKGRNHLRRSREPILEFACHEGNYAVRFILQGMRARDEAPSR